MADDPQLDVLAEMRQLCADMREMAHHHMSHRHHKLLLHSLLIITGLLAAVIMGSVAGPQILAGANALQLLLVEGLDWRFRL